MMMPPFRKYFKTWLGPILAVTCLHTGGAAWASSGAEFLRLDIPARAGALSAGCADFVELDIYNRNPSGMARNKYPEIALTHFTAFDEFVYEQLDAAFPAWLGGNWSGRIFYAYGSEFTEYDDLGQSVGTIDYHDLLLHLTYSRLVGEHVETGIGLKILESRLDEYSSIGAAADLGVRYQTPLQWLAVGLAFQNLGARTAFISEADPLPMQIATGLGVFVEPLSGHKIKLLMDYTQPIALAEDGFASAGLEYGLFDTLLLRGGYRFENELGELSLGAGFRMSGIGLDYAFQPFSSLGVAHRFTLSYVFMPKSKATEAPKERSPAAPVAGKVRELKELPRHFESAVAFQSPKVDPRIKAWRFEIRDQQGNLVKSMDGTGKPPEYLKWDGKNQQGRLMPKKGQYQFVFKAEGKAVATQEIPAFETPRRFFYTDGSQLEPEVVFVPDKTYAVAQWALQIVDQKNGRTIRTLKGGNVLPREITWDGRDEQGDLAATNRKYSYVFQMIHADGSNMVLSGKIRPIVVRRFSNAQGQSGIFIPGILFDFNSAVLKPEMMDKVLAANTILKKYGGRATAVCEGHSDDVGGTRYNQQLSAMRAGMVRDFILKKTGIAPAQIRAKGYGKTRPITHASHEDARARNRRVEIRITLPSTSTPSPVKPK